MENISQNSKSEDPAGPSRKSFMKAFPEQSVYIPFPYPLLSEYSYSMHTGTPVKDGSVQFIVKTRCRDLHSSRALTA